MTTSPELLSGIANTLRIHSITSTTAAGSGHPTSSCSAADLVAGLFFGHMRFDPRHPRARNNDRFILSKGHAAPVLYAAWVELGEVSADEILRLRNLDCDLEGHPTPRLPFVDVATGSLGQGLSVGVGMALSARLDKLDFRTYVLLGDGECAEGSVWEAANLAGIRHLNNLIAIIDVNRLGQSEATAFGHELEVYQRRFEAFGWETAVIEGHDMTQILQALDRAGKTKEPLAIIAKTLKGAGISFLADKDNWHGKALSKEEAEKAIAELQPKAKSGFEVQIPAPSKAPDLPSAQTSEAPPPEYKKGDKVATRQAYGNALARLGAVHPLIVALDGDVKNSTYAQKFAAEFPERFTECYIAEQNMVGAAIGLSTQGKIPFASTFAAFLTRAHDQIRMAGHSGSNIKLVGSHVGVSIGEDGGSQMGLEDIAMMRALVSSVVLYPCDAVSAERCTEQLVEHKGIGYLRTSRPKTPVLYSLQEEFPMGGAKVLRQKEGDAVTVVAAGITVYEALKAADQLAAENEPLGITVIDAYSIKPLAENLLKDAALRTAGLVLTVEDHFPEGGLGDAVASALSSEGFNVVKLAVKGLPRSGKTEELLSLHGIDAANIANMVKELAARQPV